MKNSHPGHKFIERVLTDDIEGDYDDVFLSHLTVVSGTQMESTSTDRGMTSMVATMMIITGSMFQARGGTMLITATTTMMMISTKMKKKKATMGIMTMMTYWTKKYQ